MALAHALAANKLTPRATHETVVPLPKSLREVAGNGKPSDPGFNASRALMRRYADTATVTGWIVIAADAQGEIAYREDNFQMRLALVSAALAALQLHWSGAADAMLAFGGFSGGAKHSGWLAAAFVAQERRVIGVFQAGINQESFAMSGKLFKVLDDALRQTPVFLLGGSVDAIATPDAHRTVQRQLKRAGFKNVQLDFMDGAHGVDPRPLARALGWFANIASSSAHRVAR